MHQQMAGRDASCQSVVLSVYKFSFYVNRTHNSQLKSATSVFRPKCYHVSHTPFAISITANSALFITDQTILTIFLQIFQRMAQLNEINSKKLKFILRKGQFEFKPSPSASHRICKTTWLNFNFRAYLLCCTCGGCIAHR